MNPIVLFALAEIIVCLVNDGWSGRPSQIRHQLYLLPLLAAFIFVFRRALTATNATASSMLRASTALNLGWAFSACVGFELVSFCGFEYERLHFARFGYAGKDRDLIILIVFVSLFTGIAARRRSAFAMFGAISVAYAAGLLLAIHDFPLNYLRSDMLPVIVWGDDRILSHLDPYTTIHVGSRLYDFPYLPGMLLAFLPAVAARLDVRWVSLVCAVAVGVSLYRAAMVSRRLEAAALLGLFLLSPFLQYRHDLYLAPHWLALVASVVLLQKGRLGWASVVFGVSMGIYQLSWVLFPFWLLYVLRSYGWRRVVESVSIGLGGMFLVIGPFLHSALHRIANNTVGQWSHMPHALADPLNLSYWLTFFIRPDQLKWLQLAAMTTIFAFCILKNRCLTLTDTLRWMSAALALFIAMNVLVDGYFYLTLLLLLMMYIFAVSGIWTEPAYPARTANMPPAMG